ncbi:hypothetical protein ACWD5Q_23540 [Streptomyces sp. NPDC002513]
MALALMVAGDAALAIVEDRESLVDVAVDREKLPGRVAPAEVRWPAPQHGPASSVAGEIAPEALVAPKHWSGDAATAYTTSVKGQPAAATQIETSADKIAGALNICAVAGMAFYVALGAILAKFITVTIAAIAALGSVVFSWAGAVMIVEEAGVNAALITAAVAALVAVIGAQAQQMAIIEGEAVDNSAFPGGHWPDALA